MITNHLKMLVVALVTALTLGGGVALTTAASGAPDTADRAGQCQQEKKDLKKAKKDLREADTKKERKEAKKDVKAAKKRLEDCQESSPDPSESPSESPSETPTDPPSGGTCIPVVEICAPAQDS